MVRNSINYSLRSVEAVLILDSEGNILVSKYYQTQDPKFAKQLFEKTKTLTDEIILFQGHLILFKVIADIIIYVIGGAEENEIMLSNLLLSFINSLNSILKYIYLNRSQVEKRTLLENLDMVFICLDEHIDDGHAILIRIILELDSTIVVARVTKHSMDSSALPLTDQTLSSVWKQAQDKLVTFLQ